MENKIVYNAIFSKMQKEINNNKEIIEKLLAIDARHSKINVDINNLIKIIEYYKNQEIENKNKKLIIYCNGNPYIVLNIAMISIIKNLQIKININNTMIGINKFILKIINDNFEGQIQFLEKEKENEKEEIIFIDRINAFNLSKNKNKIFIPYQGIDVYCEEDELAELLEKIYNYAIDRDIDIDLYEEEGIDVMLKYGTGKIKLILTNKKEIIEKYSDKNILINKNPFKEEKIIFDNNLIEKIIN